MAIETYELKIKVNDDGTTATVRNIKNEVILTGVAMKDVNAQFANLGNVAAGASTQIRATAAEMNALRTATQGASMATGGASSAVMEVGRVFSDLPYGIRGVSNNLSQLSSQMFFMAGQVDTLTGKAKGFNGVMKDMRKAMMGPLGIMVAIQVVLTAIEMLAEHFRKVSKEAAELAVGGITTATVKLGILDQAMKSSNVTLEEKALMLKRANEEFKELNLSMDTFGNLTTASANSLMLLRDELIKVSKAKVIVGMIEEQAKIMVQMETQGADYLSWYDQLWVGVKAAATGNIMFATTEMGLEVINMRKDVEKEIEKLTNKLGNDGLLPYIFGGDNKGGANKKAIKIFKQAFLDLEKEILNFQDRQQGDEKNIFKQLEQEQALEANLLQLKVDAFHEKMALEAAQAAAYLEQGRITQKEYEERMANIAHQGNEANLEADLAFSELKIAQKVETDVLIEEQEKAHWERLLAAQLEGEALMAENEALQTVNKMDRLVQEKARIEQDYADRQMALKQELADAEAQGLAIEDINQRIANSAIQNQNETLANDAATAEARIAVMGHFGAAAGALSSLLGEQTAIGKTFAIAAATIDTYVAGAKTLSDPSIPTTPARIAAMVAVIATGMATVKKIITTKVPGKSNAGGGGAGPTTFNPNFNVVGQSGQNQLAETVAGQTNEATRAYVVYDDIQSAQNIEQNSVQASSFG